MDESPIEELLDSLGEKVVPYEAIELHRVLKKNNATGFASYHCGICGRKIIDFVTQSDKCALLPKNCPHCGQHIGTKRLTKPIKERWYRDERPKGSSCRN